MVRRSLPAVVLTLLALVPSSAAAQNGATAPRTLAEILVVMGVYAVITFGVGLLLLAVSQSYVRGVGTHMRRHTLRSFLLGLGAFVASFVAVFAGMFLITGITALGAPDTVSVALMLALVFAFFGFWLLILLADALAIIVVGALVLGWVRSSPDPNLWLGLVVGILVVHLVYLIPLVNILVILVLPTIGIGAMIDSWLRTRDEPSAESESQGSVTGD
ncbi:hypothetical protein SAMN04487967_2587 [Natronorubrum sediminis]|uniref:DUF8173 domain-containing protein n=1 Tax=Natronorubrum sediminis TaxID=640943 RepID=A0A1H6FZX1_9EURY|nr:hypothetical protein [Natronorubrum sediminis]SEH16381.1 hypothetical protein SAMN04487967_2587 [Natronorubrum sediminis]